VVDTSVLVAAGSPLLDALEDGWAVSAITVGELDAGVLLADDPARRAARLRRLAGLLAEAPVLAVDAGVAARYGELRAASGRLPANDLWIAATALANGLGLITRDQRQARLPLVRATLVA
jgi:predicted nucleic acid-binding protein